MMHNKNRNINQEQIKKLVRVKREKPQSNKIYSNETNISTNGFFNLCK